MVQQEKLSVDHIFQTENGEGGGIRLKYHGSRLNVNYYISVTEGNG